MRRGVVGSVLVLSIAAMPVTWVAGAVTPRAGATPVASPVACSVTEPNGVQPPSDAHVAGRGAGDYGTGALWTALWMWGEGEIRVDRAITSSPTDRSAR